MGKWTWEWKASYSMGWIYMYMCIFPPGLIRIFAIRVCHDAVHFCCCCCCFYFVWFLFIYLFVFIVVWKLYMYLFYKINNSSLLQVDLSRFAGLRMAISVDPDQTTPRENLCLCCLHTLKVQCSLYPGISVIQGTLKVQCKFVADRRFDDSHEMSSLVFSDKIKMSSAVALISALRVKMI